MTREMVIATVHDICGSAATLFVIYSVLLDAYLATVEKLNVYVLWAK